jgi:hypothetical protein
VSYCLWKWLANSPPIYRTVLGTVLKQFSGKQSSPFMELFGQLCLTAWAIVSYCLWKWLANSPPIYRTVLGTVLKQFSGKQSSPFMELFGQLCLTVWATVSYCLWKWLANSPPIYRTVLGTVREQFADNQSSFMECWETCSCLGQRCLTVGQLGRTLWANAVLLLVQMVYLCCGNIANRPPSLGLAGDGWRHVSGTQSSPLCTVWATVSYCLGHCVYCWATGS